MKRWMWAALAAGLIAAAGVTLLALPKGQEWTTDSPEALAAFQAGMDANMKFYWDDARAKIEEAIELDPDFVIANLMSAHFLTDISKHDEVATEAIEARWAVVESADLSKLTPRERFMVERALAYRDKRYEEAVALIDEYLERFPKDPYIVYEKASRAWSRGELEQAEELNRRLVEMSPNWVIAYNQLGYINMSKGRFTEAEQYFKSYRFIAPDQANPHDSLGELFITLGRYDEAEASLEKAIEIKPDFWASYQHLALVRAYQSDFDGLHQVIERMRAASAPDSWVQPMECVERYARLRAAGEWQQLVELGDDSECVENMKNGYAFMSVHYAAAKLGDWEQAMAMELEAADMLAKVEESKAARNPAMLRAVYQHMQGVRLALQGKLGEAADKLKNADSAISYMEADGAMFKLFNRTVIAEVLLADGQDAAAHDILTSVRNVNPALVAQFESNGLSAVGLERG